MLRPTDPAQEMAWCKLTVEMVRGRPVNTVEFCESEEVANKLAEEAIKDAKDNEYATSVYVLKCIRQADVSEIGTIK